MRRAERLIAEGFLFTDQYQLTMAQLYYRMGLHDTLARFEHFYRKNPDYGQHQAGFCITAGTQSLLDWMAEARFGEREAALLASQRDGRGQPVFGEDFLAWLKKEETFRTVSLRAVPEGRVVHPGTPLTVVEGPLVMVQILETALLNHLNYQTLIATKASRVHESGRGRPVLEFGLRRAQGRGATAGVRAALIGGADFSSSVGVSHVLGYPPKGTHAHSMVQAFMALGEGELGAFRAYADIYPDSCLLLVDTIDTLGSGIPHAIQVFEELRRKGHEPLGIRLDSGDLAHLAVQAARMLDDAGFEKTSIVLSNQLDELVIWQIITQIESEAPRYGVDAAKLVGRLVYGVGTRLITSQGAAALDGVYKLAAIRRDGVWLPTTKVSETPAKRLNPGTKKLWRLYDRRGLATADLMSLAEEQVPGEEGVLLQHPVEDQKSRYLSSSDIIEAEDLHVDYLCDGKTARPAEPIDVLRERRKKDVQRLDAGVRRLVNPHRYHVSLTKKLWTLKQQLVDRALGGET